MLNFIQVYKNFQDKKNILGLKGTISFYFQKLLLRKNLIALNVPEISKSLLLRPFDSDIVVLLQVFKERECDVELRYPVNFIIDGGAYVGYTTVFLAMKFPLARIVAVEPDRDNYKILCMNCKDLKNVFPIRKAIWISNGFLGFDRNDEFSWGIKVSQSMASSEEGVEGITIPDLLRLFGAEEIDLLKLDIEGSEEKLFSSGYGDWIDKVKTMIIELHGKTCEDALLRVLSSHPFSVERRGEKWVLTRL